MTRPSIHSLHHAVASVFAIVCATGASLGGCSSSTPDPVVVLPNASATDETAASAAPSASSSPAAAHAGTTPGHVRCGKVDCKVGAEICCLESDEVGACVPQGANAKCADGKVERRCDETADCKVDERCRSEVSRGNDCLPTERWVCAPKRAKNGAANSGEVCLNGGTCSTGACKIYDPASPTGECPMDTPALSCGQNSCKAGQACCWNGKTKTGACVAADAECESGDASPDARSALYACERTSDCEPGFACYNNTGNPMQESFQCRPERCSVTTLIDGPHLCDTKVDCPPDSVTVDGKPYKLTGCVADNTRPPGVKTCQYK